MTIDLRTAAELGVPACGAQFGIGGVCDLPAGHPVPLAPGGWEHAEDIPRRPKIATELAGRRFASCVAAFGQDGEYDPYCCRWPKSCSPYPYPEAIEAGNVTEADLEPPRTDPLAELAAVPVVDEPRLELANIRRLCERHGVTEHDGNGEVRPTVAMVEELALRRPPP